MKFIELTVPHDINSGGGFVSLSGEFTKVEEPYSQIKEKLNEI